MLKTIFTSLLSNMNYYIFILLTFFALIMNLRNHASFKKDINASFMKYNQLPTYIDLYRYYLYRYYLYRYYLYRYYLYISDSNKNAKTKTIKLLNDICNSSSKKQMHYI